MNEVKKVILFLLCCAIPFSFYAQKARQNAATKKWGYEQTENKGWWENSKYRGNSMFGEWDAALVNQDYEINWLISPQYEELLEKIKDQEQLFLSDTVKTPQEKNVGQNVDFSV